MKGKFFPITVMMTQKRSRGIALLFLTSTLEGVNG